MPTFCPAQEQDERVVLLTVVTRQRVFSRRLTRAVFVDMPKGYQVRCI